MGHQAKPELLSIENVARILDVSPKTVRRLVERGELPPGHEISPRLVRWFASDIDLYLARLRVARADNPPPKGTKSGS